MHSFAYRMKKLNGGSSKYGPCMMCNQHADTTYYLTEYRTYTRDDGTQGLTTHDCCASFGHKDCLADITMRRSKA